MTSDLYDYREHCENGVHGTLESITIYQRVMHDVKYAEKWELAHEMTSFDEEECLE